MISRRLTCLATALGIWTLPLLAMAADRPAQSWTSWCAAVDSAPLILAQDQTTCFCPDLMCDNGTSPGCSASCNAPKQAQCHCEAQCNEYGNPSGSNRCECEDE
jgi:hypothetical protein